MAEALRVEMWLGDCLEVMPRLASISVKVDMVFADLPYGATNTAFDDRRTKQRLRATPISRRKSAVDLQTMWTEILRLGQARTPFIFTATQPFGSMLIYAKPELYRYELIWDKVNPTRWLKAKHMPLARHENIHLFYRKSPTYNPQLRLRTLPVKHGRRRKLTENFQEPNRHLCDPDRMYTHYQPTSIIDVQRIQKTLHPNEKPVALLEWLLRTYTNEGDMALDPVSGSATTAIAAIRTGRNCICIEKDSAYFAAAVERVRAEIAASCANVELVVHR